MIMGFWEFFKTVKREYTYAKMMNGYTPIFSQFGTNIYASDVVQQAIYSIVSEMKKLKPKHIRANGEDVIPMPGKVQRVLDNPNTIMTTSELIEKTIWMLFLNYNSFIFKQRNRSGDLIGLWPMNPVQVDFLQDPAGTLYINMQFANGYETKPIPYSSFIHLRYRYGVNDYMGGNEAGQPDNDALLKTLELNNTLLQGVSNAMKANLSINGIVKYNTIMDKGKTEQAIKELEQHLKNNEHGFLPLDLKGEFMPLQRQIQFVDKETLQFIDQKILRHYGVSVAILTGDYNTEQLAAFYQKTLEPLIIGMGQTFTKSIFTDGERSFGSRIEFYPEELIFMNTTQKLEMVRLLGDSGTMYENEKRRAFGLVPLPELTGKRMQSLNYVDVSLAAMYQTGTETGKEGTNNE